MNRIALVAGILSGATAWLILRQQNNQPLLPFLGASRRPIPVAEAAAKLQQAWADYRTTA
ncbi:MAG TPA: hypothetical protein VGD59_04765 [Acidisarcina sp.]